MERTTEWIDQHFAIDKDAPRKTKEGISQTELIHAARKGISVTELILRKQRAMYIATKTQILEDIEIIHRSIVLTSDSLGIP